MKKEEQLFVRNQEVWSVKIGDALVKQVKILEKNLWKFIAINNLSIRSFRLINPWINLKVYAL